jgi:fructose-1,6-bisphosphatase
LSANNYTPLVGTKWTLSTLLKALEQNYTYVFQELIRSDLPKDKKNERIDQCLKVFLTIYEPIMEYGVVVKKQ